MSARNIDKKQIVAFGRRMVEDELGKGTSGNISASDQESGVVLMSPSGIPWSQLEADDISVLGSDGSQISGKKPSSEVNLHLEIYKARPDVRAVVHTHSHYATVLAILGKPIQACHYLVGVAGAEIRVVDYQTFGTDALARATADGLGSDNSVLLANHGMVAVGQDLKSAYGTAVIVEEMAKLFYHASLLGQPRLLEDEQMAEARSKLKAYLS